MDSQLEGVEKELKRLLSQLLAEQAIFERIVYKNKNQHRRCSYFQYLLKVRRDLRLLQSANLEELLGSCFHVITGKKPKQKLHLLQSLKWTKAETGKHHFLDRLLGAARLLSHMTEPMLKAATEISTLLARSFFMGFSLMVLALLARLRVLVQQILLDVVLVFNAVTSISQNKQSVKIAQDSVEVYREYYPKVKDYITLDCVWKKDKFVLFEKTEKSGAKTQEGAVAESRSLGDSSVRYQSIESFLEDIGIVDEESPASIMDEAGSTEGPSFQGGPGSHAEDETLKSQSPAAVPSCPGGSELPQSKSSEKKLAFVSVKRPPPSASATMAEPPLKKIAEEKNDHRQDKFYDLLVGGSLRESLF